MKLILTEKITIYNGNLFEILTQIEDDSIDVIATDPPFFLSNREITCQNGKMVSVDKGDWYKTTFSIEEF